jgi:hypothetical protein
MKKYEVKTYTYTWGNKMLVSVPKILCFGRFLWTRGSNGADSFCIVPGISLKYPYHIIPRTLKFGPTKFLGAQLRHFTTFLKISVFCNHLQTYK